MKPSDYFKIGPRLTLAFALLIALILAGNALVIWQFHTARTQSDRLTDANQQLIAVLQLQVGLLTFHQRLDDLVRSGDAYHLTAAAEPLRRVLQEQTGQTRTAASQSRGVQVDPTFLPTLETIEVALPSQLDAINGLARSGDWVTAQRRLDNELKPIEAQTSVLVGSIQQQANSEVTQAVLEMGSVQRRILSIVPITAVSTFFIAALFGWATTRRIVELRLEERVSERTRIARELHDNLLQSLAEHERRRRESVKQEHNRRTRQPSLPFPGGDNPGRLRCPSARQPQPRSTQFLAQSFVDLGRRVRPARRAHRDHSMYENRLAAGLAFHRVGGRPSRDQLCRVALRAVCQYRSVARGHSRRQEPPRSPAD
jgi:Histidine kinase